MKILETFPKTPGQDAPEVRALWPPDAMNHPGRMRVELARRLVRWVQDRIDKTNLFVLDPLSGIGTTAIAAHAEGVEDFVGCELDERWYKSVLKVIDSLFGYTRIFHGRAEDTPPPTWIEADLLMTSPEFPDAKSPGKSKKQDKMNEEKGLIAGHEFSEPHRWGDQDIETLFGPPWGFRLNLRNILRVWLPALRSGGLVMIHVKNHVREMREVRVDEWTASVLELLGLEVLGQIVAPCDLTMYRAMHGYHLRDVIDVSEGEESATLSCGHTKETPFKGQHEMRCTDDACKIEGYPQIIEERIVVARKAI